MNEQTVRDVVAELKPLLEGRAWGKVFQTSRSSLAVDFRTHDGRYLFVSIDPRGPRAHMIARTLRELEEESLPPSSFALVLRKALGGAVLTEVSKDEGDRIIRFSFAARDAAGRELFPSLAAQLTGRSANIFLLDGEGRVVDSLRPSRGAGQEAGELYRPPTATGDASSESRSVRGRSADERAPARGVYGSLSEALDNFHRGAERERAFDERASALSSRLRQAAEKQRKLLKNLGHDLARHGDADGHRRAGDLLLANISTAVRRGSRVSLTDYYAEGAPTVELEVDEHKSLQEEAARRFALYGKAKRAAEETAGRIESARRELAAVEERIAALARVVEGRDMAALEAFDKSPGSVGASKKGNKSQTAKTGKKSDEGVAGARRYRSTDGYEILVGRSSRDNDHLTFRVARSHDLWLHAADYPGSHVVVRNHRRGEPVAHRAVIEAAQLAAHFSGARKDSKVAVNYTERKFVSKIKGGAPGLVRLSSFRTLMVEPGESLERI